MAFHSSVIAVFGSGPFVRTQKIPAQSLGFDAETECPIGQNLTEFRPNIGLALLFCGAGLLAATDWFDAAF